MVDIPYVYGMQNLKSEDRHSLSGVKSKCIEAAMSRDIQMDCKVINANRSKVINW